MYVNFAIFNASIDARKITTLLISVLQLVWFIMSNFTLQALALGFSFAALICSSFEFLTGRPANFGLMFARGVALLICMPLLVFSAPYILARNAYRALGVYGLGYSSPIVALITAIIWSIMSGRIVLFLLTTSA